MEKLKGSPQVETPGNEISLKELIIKVRNVFSILYRNKLVLILAVLTGAALGIVYSIVTPRKYQAKLTFVVEDNSDSPLGAYAGLAGQFGIDLGGQQGSAIFQGDNVMQFLQSRLIVEKALLTPVMVDGKQVTLAECYIAFKQLREKWSKKKAHFDVQYPAGQDRKTFSLVQDSVLNEIQSDLVDHYLIIDKSDKKLNFIEVDIETPMEIFSKGIVEALVHEATDFYTKTQTMHTRVNIDRLQLQADSLKDLLNVKTMNAATLQDFNLNRAKVVAGVNADIGMRDKMVVQAMYLEIAKNLEISKIAMEKEKPVIQVVDSPILPLTIKKTGKVKGAVIGAVLFGFMAGVWVLLRRYFKKVMA